jgi:uncharacterized membrane protein
MTASITSPLITDPNAVAAYLGALIAGIFWLSGIPRLKKLFDITPPVIYAYFLPTVSATVGLIPTSSPAYTWIIRYLLPMALFLLMISVDVKSILRLGPVALFMMVAGTVGIIVGAPIAFLLFRDLLPPDSWKGLAALSGSWIGGSANMVAIAKSVGTPDSVLGPVIVVDTVVGYGWMGVLLFLSGWQQRFDERTHAKTAVIAETNARLAQLASHRTPLDLRAAGILLGGGFAAAVLGMVLGERLPELGSPKIISHTTWAVLLVVTIGLLLSFTRLRRLEEAGASRIGYTALYLMMGAIGAQADLRAVLQAPAFLAAGVVWIAIHAAILLLAARLVRAPLFFVATGSMANIGGPASAPVVAGLYHPAMAPVGLLMAVAGYVLGIYGGLLTAWILGLIGG